MSVSVPLAMESFIIVIITGLVVMGLSLLLNHIWAHAVRYPLLYLVVSGPGVIIHECAHIFGCLLTGAKIKKVGTAFKGRRDGIIHCSRYPYPRERTHSGTARSLFSPLTLAALTWFFGMYAGVLFP